MSVSFLLQSVAERGIGVQTLGDGNTIRVYAGTAELHLEPKHNRKRRPTTELQLLRVDLRATALVGRDADLAGLQAWLEAPAPVSLRCVIGRAGAGKTRLAIELCDLAQQAGWTAGFARYAQFLNFLKHATSWRWNRPTLVVIDYAASLARELRPWLEHLAQPEAQARKPKLRLLLLERHADTAVGWWADLIRPVSLSQAGPDEIAHPAEPVPLPSLGAVDDRRALLAQAMRLAAEIAGTQPIAAPPAPGIDADFDGRIADDAINNEPLYLMMAGVEAIRSDARAALAFSPTDLAWRAADRERERLQHLAAGWGLAQALLLHLAMVVTLEGSCTAEDALALVAEERQAMDFPQTLAATEIVSRLAEAMPKAADGNLDAIRPDLIGEAFLLRGMEPHRLFPRAQTGILERAWRRAGNKVAAFLVRTAQDYAQGNAGHASVVWLRHLVHRADDLGSLLALAAEMPEATLALREVAGDLFERITAKLVERTDGPPDPAFVAWSYGNLALRLRELGRREQALAAAEEAVALYRALAAQRPDAFRPDLAPSLNTLAAMLSDLGRREPALAAAEEAVALSRDLAEQRPDAFRPDLAGSLNNLANRLSELGRREPALAAAEEAIALYRVLAAQRPDAFRANLAGSLNNLANRLSAVGRREPALAAAEEAVAVYRALAAQRPDAFLPDLALSLNTLANGLSDLGRRESALAAAEEAVAVYRVLAAQRPDTFRPDLATSLYTLATMLSDLGRREPALVAAEEAIALRRGLAAQRPDAFQPDLAMSLNSLANRLSAVGRREPALAAAEEAVALYRALAAQRPDAFRPNLAASLNNVANMLSAVGRREPALAAAQEAVALYRELAAQRPGAFLPDLAMSLNNLGNMLNDLGRREPGLVAAEEAVALRRELAAQRPDAFRPNLAASLNNLAAMLSALGRREPALAAAEEAVALYSVLAAQRPDAFRPDLATSLNNLANMLSAAGRREPALAAAQEAVDLYRVLTDQHAAAFRPDLAISLNNLALILSDLGQTGPALAKLEEGVEILTPLFVEAPHAFGQLMASLGRSYLAGCEAMGREPDPRLLQRIVDRVSAS